MLMLHCLQWKNMHYNILDNDYNRKYYLERVSVISKLHLNEDELNTIPSLLLFESQIKQLSVVQMHIGIDVREGIEMTEHLREDKKQEVIQGISVFRNIIKASGKVEGLELGRQEVKLMRGVGRKYKRHVRCTAYRARIERLMKMRLKEGANPPIPTILGQVREAMHINFSLMLTGDEHLPHKTEYEKIPRWRRLVAFLQFFLQHSTDNALNLPIHLMMGEKMHPYEREFNQSRVRTLNNLHISHKILRVHKVQTEVKQDCSEQECSLLLLLRDKQIPPNMRKCLSGQRISGNSRSK